MNQNLYLKGFRNHFETEAKEGSLPVLGNSPQKPPFGLYAEQISGSPFTASRHENLKTWMYRIRPSCQVKPFFEVGHGTWISTPKPHFFRLTPEALRFHPYPMPTKPTHFWDSVFTYAINGSPTSNQGSAIHLFSFNEGMGKTFAYNADAEMMLIPEKGSFDVHTEMGTLELDPLFIGVIPRGVKFQILPKSSECRGYLIENFGLPFQLPELGPIGANGLANPADFETPVARYFHEAGEFNLLAKFQGHFFKTTVTDHPLNVVAWRGNYVPYRYDLRKFNTIGTVSYDHPDPSIFTVMTSPSYKAGFANIDFVIFPPRWMVAENSFRPPYYHRNIMNEFMGLIQGQYDAKEEGFRPGGASLHNCMTGHGPDLVGFEKGTHADLKPQKIDHTMAFMWESYRPYLPTEQLMSRDDLWDRKYLECWEKLPVLFQE